mmetsp:Transcript_6669/g.15139  ORF Transcript_6669/g.15139 Transcript_6669/m.15139 type:complete len:597 (+) Transcript_6669:146-1936(+)
MKIKTGLPRLGKLTMARNNHTNQRSPFAESAYAHAESRRPRDQDSEGGNLIYYEDDVVGQTQPNLVHAEFQPLAGASVVIIANTSKKDKVTDVRTLKLMEERESLGCAVESMGGVWVSLLKDGDRTITHAVWIANDEDRQIQRERQLSHLSSETLVKLNTCLAMNIPVVSPKWLMKIGELSPGQHWSEVDVEEHVPRTIKLFNDMNSIKSHSSPHSNSLGGSISSSHRDDAASLSASISETYQNLIQENPDVMEEEALKRAKELSMLDFAIVHHTRTEKLLDSPHQILKIDQDASHSEIKNAYRQRALETHPDKGGKPGEFEAVARAYRTLLNAANNIGLDGCFDRDEGEISLKSTAHWDSELKEHRNLVRELYQNHGQDIDDNLQRQQFTLGRLGLCHKEAGSQNYNEKDEMIRNSCFYLSLAVAYLSGIGALAVWDKSGENIEDHDKTLLREADDALIRETALQLKRVIEAAVLCAHPEWAAKGMVGEEVQAFSDFLVYILESQTILSDWAIVIYDTSSGFVDVYRGQNYKDEEEDHVDEIYAASNTLTLRFVPGHYQPLVAATPESTRPTLKKIISVLDECGVLYVVTDGAAE